MKAPREILDVPVADVVRGGIRVLLLLVLATVAVRVARRAVPRAVRRLADASRRDDLRLEQRVTTLSGTLVSVVVVVVWTTALITVVGQLGVNLGPLLAGAGIVGLAVGFGAQQLVRDVINGFFILVEDQFGVGDSLTAGGVSGTVESMTLRLTRIRGDDGVLHHLRNGDLGIVSNASRGYGVASVAVPLPDDAVLPTVLERIRAAMADLAADGEWAELLLDTPQVLGVTGFREPTGTPLVTVNVRVKPEAKAKVQREVLQRSLAALERTATPAKKPAARRGARA